MNEQSQAFYGKYRGVVAENNDPLKKGRIRARVEDVSGQLVGGWANPAAPFGGSQMGFFAVPDVGAGVWIEFEYGDVDRPIWSGCWWGEDSEMPSVLDPENPKVLIRTSGGHSILLDDSSGGAGITLETSGGQKIIMNGDGIEINNGQGASIKLTNNKVSINGTALEVE